jgi:RimJ/RimL family protein N-acetyltransferase
MVLGGQPPGRLGRRRIFERPPRAGVRLSRLGSVELRDGDLTLRPFTLEDVPAITRGCRDPEILRWIPVIPRPYTEADARSFVTAEDLGHQFAIVEQGGLVGSIGMRVNQFGTGHIGYWCVKEARGRGLTPRALRLVARFGLEELGLGRLELITDPDNVASQRVAEKVGFTREAVLRSHLLHPDGRRRDSVMFSLLPGELH